MFYEWCGDSKHSRVKGRKRGVTSLGLWSSNGGFGFHSTTQGGLIWSLRVQVDAFGVAVAGTDAWRCVQPAKPASLPNLVTSDVV
jgi:hypothetical protein